MITIESMVTRARPSYTRDFLTPGICSLIKPAAMVNWCNFPPKSTQSCYNITLNATQYVFSFMAYEGRLLENQVLLEDQVFKCNFRLSWPAWLLNIVETCKMANVAEYMYFKHLAQGHEPCMRYCGVLSRMQFTIDINGENNVISVLIRKRPSIW